MLFSEKNEMKGIVLACYVVILSTFYSTCYAQKSCKLSVDEMFRLGIENSQHIKLAEIKLYISEEKEKDAKTDRYPNIQVGISESYNGQPVAFKKGLTDPYYPYMPDWSHSYGVSLTQPIYEGGRIIRSIEKRALEKQIALLGVERDKADIKILLIGKYLDLIRLYKQRDVYSKNIEEAENRLHDVEQMLKEGMITDNDLIRNQLLLTNYRLALRETNDNIVIVSQQLNIVLGMDEAFVLEPDTNILSKTRAMLPYNQFLEQAYGKYPELQMAQSEIKLAAKDIQIAQSDNLPSLSLFAGNTLKCPITSVSPVIDNFINTWNVGITVSYSLSSLYQNKHTIRATKHLVSLRKVQEEQLKQDIRTNIKASFIKHNEALDRVDALTISVMQSNENFRIVQNKYYNQLAVLTDVLDAISVRLDAELQLTDAKANAVYAYYELLRSSGNL